MTTSATQTTNVAVTQLSATKTDSNMTGSSAGAAAFAPGSKAPAVLSQASPGVQIVRDGQTMAAEAGTQLRIGDKILVPADGSAQAIAM